MNKRMRWPPEARSQPIRPGQHSTQPGGFGVPQPKAAVPPQIRKTPAAPPVYRPQPIPKVLQRKVATPPHLTPQVKSPFGAPPVAHAHPLPPARLKSQPPPLAQGAKINHRNTPTLRSPQPGPAHPSRVRPAETNWHGAPPRAGTTAQLKRSEGAREGMRARVGQRANGNRTPWRPVVQAILLKDVLPELTKQYKNIKQEVSLEFNTRYVMVYNDDIKEHVSFYPRDVGKDPFNLQWYSNEGVPIKQWAGEGWQTNLDLIGTLDVDEFHTSFKRTSKNVHVAYDIFGNETWSTKTNKQETGKSNQTAMTVSTTFQSTLESLSKQTPYYGQGTLAIVSGSDIIDSPYRTHPNHFDRLEGAAVYVLGPPNVNVSGWVRVKVLQGQHQGKDGWVVADTLQYF